jgi:membrane-bound lytic murein transglycosylase D
VACLTLGSPVFAAEAPAGFEMPASLTPVVGFWTRVYAEWTSNHVAIHDAGRVDVIYRVLDISDFEPLDGDSAQARQQKVTARNQAVTDAREEVEAALRLLDEKRPEKVAGLKGAQREAFVAWETAGSRDPERFGSAASRVRSQRGLADRFARGVVQAGRFMGAIQLALKNAGLPEGLVALSFTESLMDVNARSVSGALGPWQFLTSTGREYLAINAAVDERKDPVLSTLAAARYLTNSKQRLGSWGVAITAYNYGTNGMARAVAQQHTADIELILRDYKTSKFGFAARNYYAEFLASLHVLSHLDHYFPGLRTAPPWTFDVVALPRRTRAAELWKAGVDQAALHELNPALTHAALDGTTLMPHGLTLRLPKGRGAKVVEALKKTDAPQDVAVKTHTLKKGETLLTVARKNGLTLGELCSSNGLDPYAPVPAGKVLTLPAMLGFTAFPEAQAALQKNTVATVTFAPPSVLPHFAAALAGRRPAPEPVVLAFEDGQAKPLAPVRKGRPVDVVLASALPPTAPPEESLVYDAESRVALGKPVTRVGRAGMVLAGPVYQHAAFVLEDDMDAVDALAGDEPLPEVDVSTGNTTAQPWAPQVMPRPASADLPTS